MELDVVDRSKRAEVIGERNPALRVPTLVLDDGRPLAESNAILWYFADGTGSVPGDRYERAQVLQWQFFKQYDHEPTIAVARFWTIKGIDVAAGQLESRREGGYRALGAMASGIWPSGRSSSASATRSPTSRSMRTRTSRARAASTWSASRRYAPGSPASPHSRATCASTRRPSGRRPGQLGELDE